MRRGSSIPLPEVTGVGVEERFQGGGERMVRVQKGLGVYLRNPDRSRLPGGESLL